MFALFSGTIEGSCWLLLASHGANILKPYSTGLVADWLILVYIANYLALSCTSILLDP